MPDSNRPVPSHRSEPVYGRVLDTASRKKPSKRSPVSLVPRNLRLRGYVLHWPKMGGGVSYLFSESRSAGDSINCPVEAVYTFADAEASNDWRKPTSYLRRFGDAIQLLCSGVRPPDGMLHNWLFSHDETLQEFCIEHGPSWCQGIVLIDAARLMADDPAEGAGHLPR